MSKVSITVAKGDGIGPEIMDACLFIIKEAGAEIEWEEIEVGEKVYLRGNTTGIEDSAWESLRRTKVFYKAPITTPQGGGYKSLNVTARKTLGLYANVRPSVSYHPFVDTKHPVMDLVIVRENEEDLYTGIEYRQSEDVIEALKVLSYPGSEKIIRYAFEYARANNRKKVTAFTKDNILKMTDGMFHKVFDKIAAEYPDIQNEHWIVDIGAAKMADTPEAFDVLVLPNLYGDVLSDVAAQIAGSVGLAGSANIGTEAAMFEAIHGSAPRRANQNLANPSGLLLGGVMMLVHIGQPEAAERVHNAWLKTLEDGVHTYDIFQEGVSKQKVGTKEFAQAVVTRMGQKPQQLKAVAYAKGSGILQGSKGKENAARAKKDLVGVDVYVDWASHDPATLGDKIKPLSGNGLELLLISSRGQKVWPSSQAVSNCPDKFSCRFMAKDGTVTQAQVLDLLGRVDKAGLALCKTELLFNFDGQIGYTLAQGQ